MKSDMKSEDSRIRGWREIVVVVLSVKLSLVTWSCEAVREASTRC